MFQSSVCCSYSPSSSSYLRFCSFFLLKKERNMSTKRARKAQQPAPDERVVRGNEVIHQTVQKLRKRKKQKVAPHVALAKTRSRADTRASDRDAARRSKLNAKPSCPDTSSEEDEQEQERERMQRILKAKRMRQTIGNGDTGKDEGDSDTSGQTKKMRRSEKVVKTLSQHQTPLSKKPLDFRSPVQLTQEERNKKIKEAKKMLASGHQHLPMSSYMRDLEPRVHKSEWALHIEVLHKMHILCTTAAPETREAAPVPNTKLPNHAETYNHTLAPFREAFAKMASNHNILYHNRPVLRLSYLKRFWRPADLTRNERPCASGESCVTKQLGSAFLDEWRDSKELVIARELLLPKQEVEFIESGTLPARPNQCFFCQTSEAKDLMIIAMYNRSFEHIKVNNPKDPKEVREKTLESESAALSSQYIQLFSFEVDRSEWPLEVLLATHQPDGNPTGIVFPFPNYTEQDINWVLDEHDKPILQWIFPHAPAEHH